MSGYAKRRTWPENPDRPDDYVFRFNGFDVGRCYREMMADRRLMWTWNIYITGFGCPRERRDDLPASGMAETLEEAEAQFKAAFDRYREAGLLNGPRDYPENPDPVGQGVSAHAVRPSSSMITLLPFERAGEMCL